MEVFQGWYEVFTHSSREQQKFEQIPLLVYLITEDEKSECCPRENVVIGVLSLLPVGWKVILIS